MPSFTVVVTAEYDITAADPLEAAALALDEEHRAWPDRLKTEVRPPR